MYIKFVATSAPTNMQVYRGRGLKAVDGDIKDVTTVLGKALVVDFPRNWKEASQSEYDHYLEDVVRAQKAVKEDRRATAKLKGALHIESIKRKVDAPSPEGFDETDPVEDEHVPDSDDEDEGELDLSGDE